MEAGELKIWVNHFEHHALHPRCAPEALKDLLRPDERELIANSIATFQLGEQSTGRALLRAAIRFSRKKKTPRLIRIFELILREERRHAALLRTFMRDHQIPRKRAHWTDRCFRLLRRLGGLHLHVSVLVCAELIGNVYYRALESATDCERLQVLCRTIVSDELAHVGFESRFLLTLRAGYPDRRRGVAHQANRLFFLTVATVVWLTHRGVLREGGHNRRSFLRSCRAQYDFYLEPAGASSSSRDGRRMEGGFPARGISME